ncbi:MAG: PD40 domain-containing protein [Deltaproteobacteria bacterium]|nr:PD40 domain-containing protein [Deltaproteobacteria bacterium]
MIKICGLFCSVWMVFLISGCVSDFDLKAPDTATATDSDSAGIGDSAFSTDSGTGQDTESGTQTDADTLSDTASGTGNKDTASQTDTQDTVSTDTGTTANGTDDSDTGDTQTTDTAKGDTESESESDVIAPLVFQPAQIPDGKYNQDFEFEFTIAGGKPPYALTVEAGSNLPTGVEVTNGKLHGRPAKGGDFTFSVKVTDAGDTQTTQNFQWKVLRNKWMAYLSDTHDVKLMDITFPATGQLFTVYDWPDSGASPALYGFSPDGRYLLYTRDVGTTDELVLVPISDEGPGTEVIIVSGKHITLPTWTPDSRSIGFTVEYDAAAMMVHWYTLGNALVEVGTVTMTAQGAWAAPVDNDTLLVVGKTEAWLVDIQDNVVDTASKRAVSALGSISTAYALLTDHFNSPHGQALAISLQTTVSGPCQSWRHYVVYANDNATMVGDGCGYCAAHSANYEWMFIPDEATRGNAIIDVEDGSNTIDVARSTGYACDYNVHWDENGQSVAFLEHTALDQITYSDLSTIPYKEAHMSVAAEQLTRFGGLSPDGSRLLAASTNAVYGASVAAGELSLPVKISPDMGEEAVTHLQMSPNGELAAIVGYVADYSGTDPVFKGNVYLANLKTLTYHVAYMDSGVYEHSYPSDRFLKFSPDSGVLFFVSSSSSTSPYYYLNAVDLVNQSGASGIGPVYNTTPELFFQ